jgi:hypothetical protein
MKAIFLFITSLLLFSACQKETLEEEHELQLQSNVSLTASTYTLTINGETHTDLNAVYQLKKDAAIHWQLERDTSTTWLNAMLYLDGKAVKYDAGYKDLQLDWIVR